MTDQRKTDASLDIQLNSYTETSNPGLKSAGRHWQVYAAATGSALAAATVAAAGIIYGTGPIIAGPVPHANGSYNAAANVNIGTGQFQLQLHFNRSSLFDTNAIARLQGSGGARVFAASSKLINFAYGAPISGPSSALAASAPLFFKHGAFSSGGGNFGNGATGIAGFQLSNGDLGWIKLRWDSGDGLPSTLTALKWAYDTTPGEAVLAGTPEPGTASMALLAMGAAGLLAWRRRRRNPACQ
jgi:MYXO-CTERM domain-containing protein